MKKRLQVISVVLSAVIVLFFTGYLIMSSAGNTDGRNETFPAISDAESKYVDAASVINAAEDLELTISKNQRTTIGSETFLEMSQQNLSYSNFNTEYMCASLEETFFIDDHCIAVSEIFSDNIGYATIEGSHFSSQMRAEEYQSRFAPAVLLDPALYSSITGIDNGETYVITFGQPSGAEHWALEDSSEFVEADGTAFVSYDGRLIKSIYAITYTRANATVQLTITVEARPSSVNIGPPENASEYTPIAYLDGPRMLERACGYLLQADSVYAAYNDRAYFQAFGDERTQNITVQTDMVGTWSARVDTRIALTNTSRVGEVSQHTQTELFLDNNYSISTNGAEPVSNADISLETMRTYCQDLLVGTIMLPQYITGVETSESDNTWIVTFSASEAFAQIIVSDTCETLYGKPMLLAELAEGYTTDTLKCYLELDKSTGLPVGSGVSYSGTYTVEGLPYQLLFQADQSYDLLNQTKNAAGA